MISFDEQIELTGQTFEKLRSEGKEWVRPEELAVQYMRDHPDYPRRIKVVNFFRGIFRMTEVTEPTKASYKYRQQSAIGTLALQDSGAVEYRIIEDENGKSREYRLVPAPEAPESAQEAVNAAAANYISG